MRLDPHVIHIYAEALFASASKSGSLDTLLNQTRVLLDVLEKTPRLRHFLEAPHILKRDKLDLAGRVLEPRLHPTLSALILLLIRKGRIAYLSGVCERFIYRVHVAQGIYPASITTAHPLAADERSRLTGCLEAYTGKQLQIAWRIDPRLIGGLVFNAQDLHIDDSLLGHLNNLREQLKAVKVH